MKLSSIFLIALVCITFTSLCQAETDEKSLAEKMGNQSRQIQNYFDKLIFSVSTVAGQRRDEIERVKYQARDSFYQMEYDFKKGREQDK